MESGRLIDNNNNKVININYIPEVVDFETKNKDHDKNRAVYDILLAEGSESFFNYVDWLGLTKDPNMLILSSRHHYYYDDNELKNVKTVINVKKLNQIYRIKDFLKTIFHVLPNKSNFIGCFEENNKHPEFFTSSRTFPKNLSQEDLENGIISRIPFVNMLYNLLDSRTYKYMSKRSVSLLFKDNGFEILDFTTINGLTYFHARNNRINGN